MLQTGINKESRPALHFTYEAIRMGMTTYTASMNVWNTPHVDRRESFGGDNRAMLLGSKSADKLKMRRTLMDSYNMTVRSAPKVTHPFKYQRERRLPRVDEVVYGHGLWARKICDTSPPYRSRDARSSGATRLWRKVVQSVPRYQSLGDAEHNHRPTASAAPI